MREIQGLGDLMEEKLRDIFDGKMQLSKALSKLHDSASDYRLKDLIEYYKELNDDQVLFLKQAYNRLFDKKRHSKSETVEEMLREMFALMKRCTQNEVRDASIMISLEHLIHYQISGYASIFNFAKSLGYRDAAGLIHQNLEKERRMDTKLLKYSEGPLRAKAV